VILKVSQFDVPLSDPDSDPCDVSVLEIFDGDSERSSSFGRLCGATVAPQYISSGDTLFVKFSAHSGSLFNVLMTYAASSDGCGGGLNSLMGSFASPGFPGTYAANLECVWTIPASSG